MESSYSSSFKAEMNAEKSYPENGAQHHLEDLKCSIYHIGIAHFNSTDDIIQAK
jgi:hypothetical protein